MLERHDVEDALEIECDCEADEAEQDETVFSPRDHQAGFWS